MNASQPHFKLSNLRLKYNDTKYSINSSDINDNINIIKNLKMDFQFFIINIY